MVNFLQPLTHHNGCSVYIRMYSLAEWRRWRFGQRRFFFCEDLTDGMEQSYSSMKVKSLSRVRLFATPWTVVYQASPSMGFSRQKYWSGLPFPFPGDLPNPGIKPGSPALEADALTSEPPGKPQGIKSTPPALDGWSLNHWTAKKSLYAALLTLITRHLDVLLSQTTFL